jgi:hypothetical protein
VTLERISERDLASLVEREILRAATAGCRQIRKPAAFQAHLVDVARRAERVAVALQRKLPPEEAPDPTAAFIAGAWHDGGKIWNGDDYHEKEAVGALPLHAVTSHVNRIREKRPVCFDSNEPRPRAGDSWCERDVESTRAANRQRSCTDAESGRRELAKGVHRRDRHRFAASVLQDERPGLAGRADRLRAEVERIRRNGQDERRHVDLDLERPARSNRSGRRAGCASGETPQLMLFRRRLRTLIAPPRVLDYVRRHGRFRSHALH